MKRGLCVEPRNADLKKNLKEIDELIRADKVRREELSCSGGISECTCKRYSLLRLAVSYNHVGGAVVSWRGSDNSVLHVPPGFRRALCTHLEWPLLGFPRVYRGMFTEPFLVSA